MQLKNWMMDQSLEKLKIDLENFRRNGVMTAAGRFLIGMQLEAEKARNRKKYGRSKGKEAERYIAGELNIAQIRDMAVQQLGAAVLQNQREAQARAEQAAAYEAVGNYRYIGECTITYYCPCEECCGRWAYGFTATGIPAAPGVVAVDPGVIPLGSTVVIDGVKYLAADTGVTGNHVDICVSSHEAAEAFGVRSADVWVVEP